MIWLTFAFEAPVPDRALRTAVAEALGVAADSILYLDSTGRSTPFPVPEQPGDANVITTPNAQPEFGFVVEIQVGQRSATADEAIGIIERIVTAVDTPAMANNEDVEGVVFAKPGLRAIAIEVDDTELDEGNWVPTQESLEKMRTL